LDLASIYFFFSVDLDFSLVSSMIILIKLNFWNSRNFCKQKRFECFKYVTKNFTFLPLVPHALHDFKIFLVIPRYLLLSA
jgi:hypothetical protein